MRRRSYLRLSMGCAAITIFQAACRKSVSASGVEARDCLLNGRVVDAGHVPLAGARITALPGDGRRAKAPLIAAAEGRFTLPLEIGFYTLHVVKEGFQDTWQTIVFREPGATLSREFVLERDTSRRDTDAGPSKSH